MQRRSLLRLSSLFAIAPMISRRLWGWTAETSPKDYRQLAVQLDQLAGNIHTPADARRLVDFIAELFAKQLPPAWMGGSLSQRIAQAEYSAVSDTRRLIPEQRIADSWNEYVARIYAPDDVRVTAVEVHYLRDSFFSTSQLMWKGGSRNIWAVSSIYATQPDGRLALGCRAIESIRIIWDLANTPDNLKATREQVKQGVLTSDRLRQAQDGSPSTSKGRVYVTVGKYTNPMEDAERQFVKEHGVEAFGNAVVSMLDKTLG